MTKLETINAEDLQNRTYEPTPFLVEELLPEGLHILAGAPKIGKSWLALWLCLCVSQGQPLWNFAVTQGEVLYLSLEDSYRRIQSRLFDLTEDAPPTLHFAILADTLKHGLEQQIEQFLTEHPATKLVVIDTLQRVRSAGSDSNLYANDYQDVGLLKQLADKHHIAVLLIHHLRKLHDDDPMNMISGSTGLSGAADSAFVLQKNARSANAERPVFTDAAVKRRPENAPDKTGSADRIERDAGECRKIRETGWESEREVFFRLQGTDREYTKSCDFNFGERRTGDFYGGARSEEENSPVRVDLDYGGDLVRSAVRLGHF